MQKIRVMVADDFPEFIEYFTSALKDVDDIEVIKTVSTGSEAIEYAKKLKPDVILMDIQMENDVAGIDATKEILEILPDTKVIALSVHESSEIAAKAFDAGMVDYILKTASINEIITTIKDCMHKEDFKKINSILASEFSNVKTNQKKIVNCFLILSKLSPTETDILMNLCNGLNYRDIAKKRFVEEVSIRCSVNRITTKTGVHYIKDLIAQFNECDFFNTVYKQD